MCHPSWLIQGQPTRPTHIGWALSPRAVYHADLRMQLHLEKVSQVALGKEPRQLKNLPASAGDRDTSSIPGLGRSPGGGPGNPLQYSCLKNPTDREAWLATVHGVAKSRTRLSNFTIMIGKWKNNRILYHQNYHLIEKPVITF